MIIEGLQCTKPVPQDFKNLSRYKKNWIVNESIARLESVDSSTVSFVRHNYTNYEELLSSLESKYPLRKRATQKEMLDRYFAMQEEYKAIKQSANHLVIDMLNEAYGENWS